MVYSRCLSRSWFLRRCCCCSWCFWNCCCCGCCCCWTVQTRYSEWSNRETRLRDLLVIVESLLLRHGGVVWCVGVVGGYCCCRHHNIFLGEMGTQSRSCDPARPAHFRSLLVVASHKRVAFVSSSWKSPHTHRKIHKSTTTTKRCCPR